MQKPSAIFLFYEKDFPIRSILYPEFSFYGCCMNYYERRNYELLLHLFRNQSHAKLFYNMVDFYF